jgi:hypothetical protein
MTYLEVMRQKFPGMSEEDIIRKACPDEVQLEGTSPCTQHAFSTAMDFEPCRQCWNRECVT